MLFARCICHLSRKYFNFNYVCENFMFWEIQNEKDCLSAMLLCLCRHVDIYNPISHVYQRLQPTMYHEFILLVSRQYANKTTLKMDAFIMYMVVEPCNAHVSCDTLSSHVKVYICWTNIWLMVFTRVMIYHVQPMFQHFNAIAIGTNF